MSKLKNLIYLSVSILLSYCLSKIIIFGSSYVSEMVNSISVSQLNKYNIIILSYVLSDWFDFYRINKKCIGYR